MSHCYRVRLVNAAASCCAETVSATRMDDRLLPPPAHSLAATAGRSASPMVSACRQVTAVSAHRELCSGRSRALCLLHWAQGRAQATPARPADSNATPGERCAGMAGDRRAVTHKDVLSRAAALGRVELRVTARTYRRSCAAGPAAARASLWTAPAATTSAGHTGMSSAIPPLQLQRPLPSPLPLRLRRCSLCRVRSICPPSSVLPSSCYISKARRGNRSVSSSQCLSRRSVTGFSTTSRRAT